MKMTGRLWTPAKFIASWTSPWLAVPSPNEVWATTLVAADPRAHRDPDGVEHLRPDRRRQRDDVVRRAAVVAGHLASTGRHVVGLGEVGGDDVLGAHAEGHGRGDRAVVRRHPVGAAAHRPGGRDLRALVALAADDEGDLARALHEPHPLVHGAGEQHGAVHREHVLVARGRARRAAGAYRSLPRLPSLLATRGWPRRRPPGRPRRGPRSGSDERGRSSRSRPPCPAPAGPASAPPAGRRHAGR